MNKNYKILNIIENFFIKLKFDVNFLFHNFCFTGFDVH